MNVSRLDFLLSVLHCSEKELLKELSKFKSNYEHMESLDYLWDSNIYLHDENAKIEKGKTITKDKTVLTNVYFNKYNNNDICQFYYPLSSIHNQHTTTTLSVVNSSNCSVNIKLTRRNIINYYIKLNLTPIKYHRRLSECNKLNGLISSNNNNSNSSSWSNGKESNKKNKIFRFGCLCFTKSSANVKSKMKTNNNNNNSNSGVHVHKDNTSNNINDGVIAKCNSDKHNNNNINNVNSNNNILTINNNNNNNFKELKSTNNSTYQQNVINTNNNSNTNNEIQYQLHSRGSSSHIFIQHRSDIQHKHNMHINLSVQHNNNNNNTLPKPSLSMIVPSKHSSFINIASSSTNNNNKRHIPIITTNNTSSSITNIEYPFTQKPPPITFTFVLSSDFIKSIHHLTKSTYSEHIIHSFSYTLNKNAFKYDWFTYEWHLRSNFRSILKTHQNKIKHPLIAYGNVFIPNVVVYRGDDNVNNNILRHPIVTPMLIAQVLPYGFIGNNSITDTINRKVIEDNMQISKYLQYENVIVNLLPINVNKHLYTILKFYIETVKHIEQGNRVYRDIGVFFLIHAKEDHLISYLEENHLMNMCNDVSNGVYTKVIEL